MSDGVPVDPLEFFGQWPKDVQEASVVLMVALTWRRFFLMLLRLAAPGQEVLASSPGGSHGPGGDEGGHGDGDDDEVGAKPVPRRRRRRQRGSKH